MVVKKKGRRAGMGEGKKYVICEKELEVYRRDMLENERSRATIEKYIRDVRAFCRWNGEKEIDRLRVLEWKEYLGTCYAVSSANSMLAALNGYFDFRGWEELRVKPFRQQKRIYTRNANEYEFPLISRSQFCVVYPLKIHPFRTAAGFRSIPVPCPAFRFTFKGSPFIRYSFSVAPSSRVLSVAVTCL